MKTHTMPMKEFIEEHRRLDDVLKRGDPRELQTERAKQRRELNEVVRRRGITINRIKR